MDNFLRVAALWPKLYFHRMSWTDQPPSPRTPPNGTPSEAYPLTTILYNHFDRICNPFATFATLRIPSKENVTPFTYLLRRNIISPSLKFSALKRTPRILGWIARTSKSLHGGYVRDILSDSLNDSVSYPGFPPAPLHGSENLNIIANGTVKKKGHSFVFDEITFSVFFFFL